MFTKNSSIPIFFQISLTLLIMIFVILAIYYLIYIGNKKVDSERRLIISWKKVFNIIAILLVFSTIYYLFNRFPILGSTSFAFFVSVIVAFIINPLVNKLEKRNIKRGLATIIVYLSILSFFVILGFLVIPRIVNQATNFVNNIPGTVNYLIDSTKKALNDWNIDPKIFDNIQNNLKNYISDFSKNFFAWSSNIYQSLYGSLGKLLIVILIPIISYYLVVDKDKIIGKIYSMIPKKYKKDAKFLYNEINVSMGDIVRGRIIMAIFVGVFTAVMLMILNIDFALIIGIITMVADIIPYVGPFMGFTPAFIFAFIASPIKALWVGLLFLFIQWFENNILGPKVLGDSTGLHPLAILISIIIGGGIYGVWGMILSVPFISLVSIFYDFFKMKLKEKN